MRFNTLDDWLAWQETLNPAEIDLGLERVGRVLKQAGLSAKFNCPLITVAGTNGKGSVVAMLEAIAMAAGVTVCSYTSPHLVRYNERIKINGQAVDDRRICESFERIDQARDELPVTYFEFGTLAAIDLFTRQQPDLVILEVGLGGRLDAVNIMDADIAIITSIAIDHVDWLGDNRESIGYEKAGIFRTGITIICEDALPPQTVIEHAQQLQCALLLIGRDYNVQTDNARSSACGSWTLQSCFGDMSDLPPPSLQGEFQKSNAATAILALQALVNMKLLLPQSTQADNDSLRPAVAAGLKHIELPGRFQQIHGSPQVYVDVAHNPHAAQSLSAQLKLLPAAGKTWAIVAMLADKDATEVIDTLSGDIDMWCLAGLEPVSRGLAVEDLAARLPASINVSPVKSPDELRHDAGANQCTILSDKVLLAKSVVAACQCVLTKTGDNDRIIIFGSFYTVSEAMQLIQNDN